MRRVNSCPDLPERPKSERSVSAGDAGAAELHDSIPNFQQRDRVSGMTLVAVLG